MPKKIIAERPLLYSLKGKKEQRKFCICILAPYAVTQDMVDFNTGEKDLYACELESVNFEESLSHISYGVDEIQAIDIISSTIDPLIKRLQKKYNIFWPDGEPYFDDDLK